MPGVPLLSNTNISEEKLLRVIRALNPSKAYGWDGISVRMIKICDSSLVLPLKMIFELCLIKCSFPEAWKRGNVVSVHRKIAKILKKTIEQFLYFQYLVKFLKNLFVMVSINTLMIMAC